MAISRTACDALLPGSEVCGGRGTLSRSAMAERPVDIHRNDYVVITLEFEGRIVRYRRTATPFPSLATAKEVYDGILRAYDRIGKQGRGLLIDARDAIGRNDPEFEALLIDFRSKSLTGFAANAVLIKTAVGMLQVKRHGKTEDRLRVVTADPEEAIEHLLSLSPGPSQASQRSGRRA